MKEESYDIPGMNFYVGIPETDDVFLNFCVKDYNYSYVPFEQYDGFTIRDLQETDSKIKGKQFILLFGTYNDRGLWQEEEHGQLNEKIAASFVVRFNEECLDKGIDECFEEFHEPCLREDDDLIRRTYLCFLERYRHKKKKVLKIAKRKSLHKLKPKTADVVE